jgi:hypothetical protein
VKAVKKDINNMFPLTIEKRYPLVSGLEITLSAFLESSQLGPSEYYFDKKSLFLAPYVYTVETAINEFLCLNQKNYKLNEMQRLSYNIMI